MMQPAELRIGNLISVSKNDEVVDARTVTAIQKDLIEFGGSGTGTQTVSYDNVSGIFFTPEILEKAGFEKDLTVDDFHFLTIEDFRIGFSLDETWLEKGDGDFIEEIGLPHCKYVHQLQNLVFVLTGKELQLSL